MEKINIDNVKKAIDIGICYVKPFPRGHKEEGKIRGLDNQAGYGECIDLTREEYELYQKVSQLTKQEMFERLEKLINYENKHSK